MLSLILLIGYVTYVANDYNIGADRVNTKSVESIKVQKNMDS